MVRGIPHSPLRVGLCRPLVVIVHPRAPTEAIAAREAEAIEELLRREGARAVLLWVGRPMPSPSVAALRHYRRVIVDNPQLEGVALVLGQVSGFALTVTSTLAVHLSRLTPLAGAFRIFDQLDEAVDWLELRLDHEFDYDALVDELDALGRS